MKEKYEEAPRLLSGLKLLIISYVLLLPNTILTKSVVNSVAITFALQIIGLAAVVCAIIGYVYVYRFHQKFKIALLFCICSAVALVLIDYVMRRLHLIEVSTYFGYVCSGAVNVLIWYYISSAFVEIIGGETDIIKRKWTLIFRGYVLISVIQVMMDCLYHGIFPEVAVLNIISNELAAVKYIAAICFLMIVYLYIRKNGIPIIPKKPPKPKKAWTAR